jgi:UDP-N-acetylmuramyl pentapeptide phosphotransferase/UDP-N-acetylglucosamine-1-phosphate transferase
MTPYLLTVFIISLFLGTIFTPATLNFCKRKKLYDIPNERKIHKNAIPRLGGLSFYPSMMIAFIFFLLASSWNNQLDHTFNIWSASYLAGLLIIYTTGIIDDLIGLTAKSKFIAQIIAASLLPMTGLTINNLYGLFGIYYIPYYAGVAFTIFAIVFICNAINLIDGIDGLAGSISLLALGGFLGYFVYYDVFSYTYTVLAAGMMGALVAFLYYNLFGKAEKNTKIFMGDSGSLSLGYTLGFFAIKTAMDHPVIWETRPEAFLFPLTLLFVPIADVVRVTFYRLFHGYPLFDADKNHIHHKLLAAGLNQHQALITILAFEICYMVLNLVVLADFDITYIVVTDVIIFMVFHLMLDVVIHRRELLKTS